MRMTMKSPCIDVCDFEDDTGWCLGCGMLRKEKRLWKKEPEERPAIADRLPGRLDALEAAGHLTGKPAGKKKLRKRHEEALRATRAAAPPAGAEPPAPAWS